MTSRKSRPRNERLVAAEGAIKANGYRSVNAALRAVDLDRTTYTRTVVLGLTDNPRMKTVEKFRRLGIFQMLKPAV